MAHFGDPTFAYHAEMARIVGTIALRLDDADVLPFDYSAYASEIAHAEEVIENRATSAGGVGFDMKPVSEAASALTASAGRASSALAALSSSPLSGKRGQALNRSLVSVEQALLAPEGLTGRPWYRHTIYAPGSYAGYAAVVMPGVSEAIDRHDNEMGKREAASLAAALRRAASKLDDVTRLAK
ncbi:MAG: transferrin receptor-like dimerization domain-containing protein, partial [Candidatus Acidiferrales bacterium]